MMRAGVMAALFAPQAGMANDVQVQLEAALSYLEQGRYAEAQLIFESVLHLQEDSLDLPSQVEAYEQAARDYQDEATPMTRFGYAEAGFGGYRVNETPATQSGERDSLFTNLRVGGGLEHRLDRAYAVDASVDYRHREHDEPGVRDDSDLRWRLGGSRSGDTNNWAGGLRGRVSYRGNGDHRNDTSVFTNLDHRVDAKNQLRFGAELRRRSYPQGRLRERSRSTADVSARWAHVPSDGVRLAATVHTGRNYATRRPDGDSSFHGVMLELDHTLSTTLAWHATWRWEHDAYNTDAIRYFPDENDVVILRRDDDLYEFGARLSWRFADGWTFRPEVLYTRDESNILNFNYSATEYWINVRKSF